MSVKLQNLKDGHVELFSEVNGGWMSVSAAPVNIGGWSISYGRDGFPPHKQSGIDDFDGVIAAIKAHQSDLRKWTQIDC